MTTAIVTIVMFLVMISIHEFGHFAVSKLCGVKVLEFAVGMGPAIFKKQKGETLYSIRALPIGGFCRLEGEENNSSDKAAFCNQAAWKRFLILVAGAVLNIVLGYFLFVMIVSRSEAFTTNVIESIDQSSYLEQAGVCAGDKIISINGHSISFYPEIELYSRDFSEGETATIKVKRGKEKFTFDVPLSTYSVKQTYEDDGVHSLTITNGNQNEEIIPYSENLPKDEAKIGKSAEYNKVILGFKPATKKTTVFSVATEAFHYTKYVVKLVYKSLFDMITGKIGINQMSGPVGIVSEVNNVVNSGQYRVENTLNLIGLITINLGIFNLLPLPALDGGRLLFIVIEVIRRKPVPADKEAIVHVIGFALLMALTLFITFFDVFRLINK